MVSLTAEQFKEATTSIVVSLKAGTLASVASSVDACVIAGYLLQFARDRGGAIPAPTPHPIFGHVGEDEDADEMAACCTRIAMECTGELHVASATAQGPMIDFVVKKALLALADKFEATIPVIAQMLRMAAEMF